MQCCTNKFNQPVWKAILQITKTENSADHCDFGGKNEFRKGTETYDIEELKRLVDSIIILLLSRSLTR